MSFSDLENIVFCLGKHRFLPWKISFSALESIIYYLYWQLLKYPKEWSNVR